MEAIPDYPSVSVIIPTLGDVDGLCVLLPTILDQEYAGSFEILVADGRTDDKTGAFIRQHYPMIRLVSNPEQATSIGINRALAMSTGEVVVRCDAYNRLQPDYIQRAVETLRRTGAASVGGQQCAVGESFIGRAVAAGQNTFLGVGNSRHRLGGVEGPADTVYLGVFRRKALEAVGGFDPTLLRNQDYVLNWCLRHRGETVWFDPDLKVAYRPRQSIWKLARQYFDYGRWKCVVIRRYPRSVCVRQVVAPLLLLGLAASAVGAWINMSLWASALPLVYILLLLGETVRIGVRRREPAAVLLPLVLIVMHLSWGAGFFCPPWATRKKGTALMRKPFSGKAMTRTPQHPFPSESRSAGPPIEPAWPVKQEGASEISAESVAKAGSRLSVMILTWNSVGKIEPCLEALLQGTRVPDEIIVVDNGSKDQTPAVLAMRFPSVRVIENTTNLGVARARNQGLAAARGTYVLVLDDDAIMQPKALAQLVAVLDASPTVALCGPQLLSTTHEPISTNLTFPTLSHKVRRWGRVERQTGSPWDNSISGRMREVDYVIGACQLIRRAALDEVGLYDEHIFYGPEDIDFCLRLRQAGWRIILQPAARVIHAEQRIARSIFSPIGRKHTAGLGYYFWKHRYGLSQSRLYERLPTFSPVSHSL